MDYWQKLTQLAAQMPTAEITAQLNALTAWRTAVAVGTLPRDPLPRLGLTGEAMAQAEVDFHVAAAPVRALDHLLRHFRQYVAYHYGMWAFVQMPLFAEWTRLFGPLRYLEVAAGNGYVSAGLQAAGNHVTATDSLTWRSQNVTGRTPLVPVRQAGASAALWQYGTAVDAVVMAWSPDHEWSDAAFLKLLRSQFPHLLCFVIGERFGATNSRLFWQLAQFVPDRRLLPLNRAFPRFDAINDRIYLIQ